MSINATLLGQTLAFILFVWFCMKYVWPPLLASIEKRQQVIADGLAKAEKAEKDLELAQKKAAEFVKEAKLKANEIVEQANSRKMQIIDEAKQDFSNTMPDLEVHEDSEAQEDTKPVAARTRSKEDKKPNPETLKSRATF